jgi:hypothetical protein
MGNSASGGAKHRKTSVIQVAPAPNMVVKSASNRNFWQKQSRAKPSAVKPQTPPKKEEEEEEEEPQVVKEDIPPEREVLEKFFCSTNGGEWRTRTGWMADGPLSSFYGVIFGMEKVMGLGLTENELSGKLPDEIGYLRSLQYMYAQDNNITGKLPASIAQMSSICVLELNGNMLEGSHNDAYLSPCVC